MYIQKVKINNIQSLKYLEWNLSDCEKAGWHVVIGNNGAGKSAFLRSMALALIGPTEAMALRQNWRDWLRKGESEGYIRLELVHNVNVDKFSGRGNTPQEKEVLPVRINFSQTNGSVKLKTPQKIKPTTPNRHVWGSQSGWFSASYGPFRRFAGGERKNDRIFQTNPKAAAHLSVFGEDVALTECLTWLQELRFKQLEDAKSKESRLLEAIKDFVNQDDFLPNVVRLNSVSSESVEFVDKHNHLLSVEALSDGYRSILSMTFELIRQLVRTYGVDGVFPSQTSTQITVPGVVLIDEIDAHLHPTWQTKIGSWFCQHFPKIQFIVTTHSPLICQAADIGTVYRLSDTDAESHSMIQGLALQRLIYGNVLDAYGTEAFGKNVTRSSKSEAKAQRLAELNQKAHHIGLTQAEQEEREKLLSILPTTTFNGL